MWEVTDVNVCCPGNGSGVGGSRGAGTGVVLSLLLNLPLMSVRSDMVLKPSLVKMLERSARRMTWKKKHSGKRKPYMNRSTD